MKSWSETTQMKATDQYFPMALFIMLCKVVLTFESADEILKCSHFNESYWAVLFCVTVYYAVKDTGSNFWVCGWNSNVWPFKWKRLNSILLCRDVLVTFVTLIWLMLIFPAENKDPDAVEVLISCQTATGCRVLGKWKWKKTKTKVNFNLSKLQIKICSYVSL